MAGPPPAVAPAPGPARPVLLGLALALVAAVVAVRPTTAADAVTPAAARPAGHLRAQPPAGAAPVADDLVLGRGGTPAVGLGEAVADLRRRGWQPTGTAGHGCEELAPPAGDEPAAGEDVRLHAWARAGRVVAVRVEAPATPGLLLPTAVRTGWSLEAVRAGSDGLLAPVTVRGPDGAALTVLAGRLPPGAWPPEVRAAPPAGRGAAEPPPPSVELLLGDGGTGRVVSAEVRVPAAHGCPGTPDEG